MFVCPFGGGGSLHDVASCLTAWSHVPSRGLPPGWGSAYEESTSRGGGLPPGLGPPPGGLPTWRGVEGLGRPESEKWAVRTLLECFLVFVTFATFVMCYEI